MPATGGYVGAISDNLPHSTQSLRFCLLSHILTFGLSDIFFLHTVYNGPSGVLNTLNIMIVWFIDTSCYIKVSV